MVKGASNRQHEWSHKKPQLLSRSCEPAQLFGELRDFRYTVRG